MRTNNLIWLGLALLIGIAAVVVINTGNAPSDPSHTASTDASKVKSKNKRTVTADVEGDTVVDTVKNVQAKYEGTEKKVKELTQLVEKQQFELKQLRVQTGNDQGDDRVSQLMTGFNETKTWVNDLSSQIRAQSKRFETTESNGYEFSQSDLGLGEATVGRNRDESASPTRRVLVGYAAVPVLSETATPSIGPTIHNDRSNSLALKDDPLVRPNQDVDNAPRPYRTIPANSTLFDAISMTAMIGRVPTGGTVKDPFPVKLVLGRENLATNNIRIPDIEGIVFEGVASGNWNLSCISVSLTSATYTFKDGRIQHLKKVAANSGVEGLSPLSDGSSRESIGYISNEKGVPCVAGQRVTDAHKQMATVGLLGLASNYFNARAEAEVTNTNNAVTGSQSTVTGDPKRFARNEAISDSLQNATDFYINRNRDTFDAIVSHPGEAVVLHITSDLYIDYNENARKVAYAFSDDRNKTSELD